MDLFIWFPKLSEYDRYGIFLLSQLTEKFPRKAGVPPVLKTILETRQFEGLVRALHCDQISHRDLYPDINTKHSFLICLSSM